jgi:hypothetical protein
MNTTEPIRLIDGTFTADEARDILVNLFNYKINFHELKNFSSWERHGLNHPHSAVRLPELKTDRERVVALINEAMAAGDEVVVLSTISIQRVKTNKAHVQKQAPADRHEA